jgi:hypothetical protein
MSNLFRRYSTIPQPGQDDNQASTACFKWNKYLILIAFTPVLLMIGFREIERFLSSPRPVPVADTTSAERLMPFFAADHRQYHDDAAIQLKKLPIADVLRVVLATLQPGDYTDNQIDKQQYAALRCLLHLDLNRYNVPPLLIPTLTSYAEWNRSALSQHGSLLPVIGKLQMIRLIDADHLRRLIRAADFKTRFAIIGSELRFAKTAAIEDRNAVSTLGIEEITTILEADISKLDQRIQQEVNLSDYYLDNLLRDMEIAGQTLKEAVAVPSVGTTFLGRVQSCNNRILSFLDPNTPIFTDVRHRDLIQPRSSYRSVGRRSRRTRRESSMVPPTRTILDLRHAACTTWNDIAITVDSALLCR